MKETKFKDTEVGRIPEDWEVKPIGEVADVKTGPFGSALHADDYVLDGTPIITVEHIGKIHIDTTNGVPYVSNKDYMRLIVYSLKESDIVFSRVGSVDRCSHVSKNENGWLFSGRLLRVRLRSVLDSLYLTYHLQTNEAKQRVLTVAVGLAMPSINTKILNGVLVAFPHDKSEQSRIATALSTIDNLISELGKLIEKKRAIKQGTMQQLLTGKKRLKGFNEPWAGKKLGKLCNLFGRIGYRGYTKADLVQQGEGAISFSPSDIISDKINYDRCTYISAYKYEESPEIKVYNGDIIFCKTASIGKCALVENLKEKATINPQFVVMKNFICNNKYLYYRLIDVNFQNKVKEIVGGSTIPTMSQEKLKEQILLMPSDIAEQTAIAEILSDMDKEIANLEVKKSKYEKIKQGMMQQLLTGKIRLI